MILMNGISGLAGLGGMDRNAAASYCGQKFGVTSTDFQPCVNFYAAGMAGDYKPEASGSSGSGGGGWSFDWNGLVSSLTTGAVKGLVGDHPGGAPGGGVPLPPPPPAAPWYTTPTGMIGIGVGALALIMLLRK